MPTYTLQEIQLALPLSGKTEVERYDGVRQAIQQCIKIEV
jgi:hypothetical protein